MKTEFARSMDSLEQVFQFTERFFDRKSIAAANRFPIHFSIEELFTNMVKYNREGSDDIVLKLKLRSNQMEVSLIDRQSQPFDITKVEAADTTSPLAKREPGGLGLHLIRKLVDTIDYHYAAGCSKITFTKQLG